MELDQVNLPHEKDYRLPVAAEIEGAKHFININLPKIFKENIQSYNPDLIKFYSKINELTAESFSESIYLSKLNFDENIRNKIIYLKQPKNNLPYIDKNEGNLNVGFRYAQTYRKVLDSN